MFRMASVSIFVECEERVSMVEGASSVSVMDGLSLMVLSVSACATVLLLTASVGLFVQGWIVLLVFLFLFSLFHRWCKKASWLSFAYVGRGRGRLVLPVMCN